MVLNNNIKKHQRSCGGNGGPFFIPDQSDFSCEKIKGRGLALCIYNSCYTATKAIRTFYSSYLTKALQSKSYLHKYHIKAKKIAHYYIMACKNFHLGHAFPIFKRKAIQKHYLQNKYSLEEFLSQSCEAITLR